MKETEVPQDKEDLFEGKTQELLYTVDEEGEYTTAKSKGWEVKNEMARQAWEAVKEEVEEALLLVKSGQRSPLYYYMKRELMDVGLLSQYTGMFSWRVKRHMLPKIFNRLSNKVLCRYCEALNIKDLALLTNIERLDADFEEMCKNPMLS